MKKKIIVLFIMLFLVTTLAISSYSDLKDYKNQVELITVSDKESYYVYKPNLKYEKIKLFWKNEDKDYSKLLNLNKSLKSNGENLLFAMNGGIYSKDYKPTGLYIEDGEILNNINYSDGEGNFFIKPNGIFYIKDEIPYIITTGRFDLNDKVDYALQSGPMLIIDGVISNKFTNESNSEKIRNAVGIDKDGNAYFIFTKKPVNMYSLALFGKEHLNLENLLYLDGTISKIYDKENFNKIRQYYPFVSIIGVLEK